MGLELCILPKTTPYGANLNPWTSHQEHSTIHRKPSSQQHIRTPGLQPHRPLPRRTPSSSSTSPSPPLSPPPSLPFRSRPRVVSPRSENSTQHRTSSSSNSSSRLPDCIPQLRTASCTGRLLYHRQLPLPLFRRLRLLPPNNTNSSNRRPNLYSSNRPSRRGRRPPWLPQRLLLRRPLRTGVFRVLRATPETLSCLSHRDPAWRHRRKASFAHSRIS